MFDTTDRFITIKEFTMIVGLSRSTCYLRFTPKSPYYDDFFPKPIKVGKTTIRFSLADTQRWMKSRKDLLDQ